MFVYVYVCGCVCANLCGYVHMCTVVCPDSDIFILTKKWIIVIHNTMEKFHKHYIK